MSRGEVRIDLYGGALCALLGCVAAYIGTRYGLGTPADIGPGLFPTSIGILLALAGVAIATHSARERGEAVEPPDLRGALCIAAGMIAFGVIGSYGGLAPASFALILISALGDRDNTLVRAALLAVALTVIGVVVFWWALKLQMPLFAWGWS
ncbi:MAG: tripartite tricarboxylate transporter TctB family protein [Methylobacteriaceae bacterium]|nr:tripartite tricarboxylate transporter TctB family protein [Methylobacteriaceae bacterium]